MAAISIEGECRIVGEHYAFFRDSSLRCLLSRPDSPPDERQVVALVVAHGPGDRVVLGIEGQVRSSTFELFPFINDNEREEDRGCVGPDLVHSSVCVQFTHHEQ